MNSTCFEVGMFQLFLSALAALKFGFVGLKIKPNIMPCYEYFLIIPSDSLVGLGYYSFCCLVFLLHRLSS